MRKKILYFVAIAAIVLFGACSNEELMPETERTFTFTASMPDDSPATRVLLEESGKNIVLKWESGDQLEIAVVQGTNFKDTTIATLTEILDNGKKAKFSLTWPGGLDTSQPFGFYGVYGGGGQSTNNPTDVILPTNTGAAISLANVKSRKDVMLYFAAPNILPSDVTGGVTFKHLGSIFSITLKNISTNNDLVLNKARLEGTTSDNADWAYNSVSGGNIFDMVSETFNTTTGTNGNFISFSTDVASLPAGGGVMTFVAWYPLLPNNSWPELKLVLDDGASTPIVRESVNRKPARAPSAIAGMNYHFYAVFDGANLNFTNAAFVVTP